jgi:SprT protein
MPPIAVIGLHDSPLSPWQAAPFLYRQRKFACVAQLVAYSRACQAGDRQTADIILGVEDPRELRRYTTRVSVDDVAWRSVMERVMLAGMREMVLQNPACLAALLTTGNRRIAFAVAGDLIWGTGLAPIDPRLADPAAWPGSNLLGALLETLRDTLCGTLLPLAGPASAYQELDTHARNEVHQLVRACCTLAGDLYDIDLALPEIRFDLKGTTAGQAMWKPDQSGHVIRFNEVLLSENWDAFRVRTIPHEVAHLVVRQRYGSAPASHGPEWMSVMRDFGCDPSRCHSYSVVNASTGRGQRNVMRCRCRLHLLSQRRSARELLCGKCRQSLQFIVGEADLMQHLANPKSSHHFTHGAPL